MYKFNCDIELRECDNLHGCYCSKCVNYENFFGTRVDSRTICEISSLNLYEICKVRDCRKCYCGMYEPCKGVVGCAYYVERD